MKVQSLDQFAAERGLVTDAEVQGHIHAGLRCAPDTKTFRRFFSRRLTELQNARDAVRDQYREAIARGEVRDFTREEALAMTAGGHDDNPAVQAARRILEKRGQRMAAPPDHAKPPSTDPGATR